MKKNSGAPGAPTNRAVELACGKYIYPIDADDLLINVALEQLYDAAEKFNAQVVHTARYFYFHDDSNRLATSRKNISISTGSVDTVAFLTDDVGERIKILCNNVLMGVTGWQKFVRRDLLTDNEIISPENMKGSQDLLWTVELLFYAERYLMISQPLYIHRLRSNSNSQGRRGALGIEYWGNLFVRGMEYLCKFFARHKFFRDNPQCMYMLLDWYVKYHEQYFVTAISEIEPPDAQRVLEKFFAKDFGEHCGLISYLCTSLNVARLNQHLKQFTDSAK